MSEPAQGLSSLAALDVIARNRCAAGAGQVIDMLERCTALQGHVARR